MYLNIATFEKFITQLYDLILLKVDNNNRHKMYIFIKWNAYKSPKSNQCHSFSPLFL